MNISSWIIKAYSCFLSQPAHASKKAFYFQKVWVWILCLFCLFLEAIRTFQGQNVNKSSSACFSTDITESGMQYRNISIDRGHDLFSFSFHISFANSMTWVDWTSMIYMILYIPLVFPGSWILDKLVSSCRRDLGICLYGHIWMSLILIRWRECGLWWWPGNIRQKLKSFGNQIFQPQISSSEKISIFRHDLSPSKGFRRLYLRNSNDRFICGAEKCKPHHEFP